MKCPFCSAEVQADAKICDFCGGPLDRISPALKEAEPIPPAFPAVEAQLEEEAPPQPAVEAQPAPAAPPDPVVQATPFMPPPQAPAAPSDRSVLAILSLVLGAVSIAISCLVVCAPLSIAGLVFGLLGRNTPNRKWANAGIIINVAAILMSLLAAALYIAILTNFPEVTDWNISI